MNDEGRRTQNSQNESSQALMVTLQNRFSRNAIRTHFFAQPPGISFTKQAPLLTSDERRDPLCLPQMKRVLIIGPSGSGKSTLARQLGEKLHLPVIHLDKHFWQPGWVGTPHQEWVDKITKLVAGERWILDGNYRHTLDIRLQAADTVIFLDLPRWLCSWRALKRRFQYMRQPRPDITEGCVEKIFDPNFPKFIRWIWGYTNRARPDVVQRLVDLGEEKQIIWLRSPREVKRFLNAPRQWEIEKMKPVAA